MNEKLMTTFIRKINKVALPISEHLQISVDVKLFVHDRVTSTF